MSDDEKYTGPLDQSLSERESRPAHLRLRTCTSIHARRLRALVRQFAHSPSRYTLRILGLLTYML